MWKLTLFVLPILCAAQSAQVDGRVTDLSGTPLPKATVALLGNTGTQDAPLPPTYTALSDAEGRFKFDEVESGVYRVFAERIGYQFYVFTQPDGRVVSDFKSGTRNSLEIKMVPQSFISGRVFDEDGAPFPGARVTVLRMTRVNGARQLASSGTSIAGPDGSFTIGSLNAGRYYITASSPPSLADTNQRESGPAIAHFVPTYFPSALEASQATMIDLPAGRDLRLNDIRMRRIQTFHIRGRIVNTSGLVPPSMSITLSDPRVRLRFDAEPNRASAVQGMFQFNRLLPGTYTLSANASGNLRGRQTITVTDRDVNDFTLTMGVVSPVEIPVMVSVEDADPAQRERIMSQAYSRYTLTATTGGFGSNAMISRKPDGSPAFLNIQPGVYRTGIGTPDGAYIKSLRYGDNDVTTKLLEVSTGAALAVVFSPHAAEVAGTVRNKEGISLAGVQVTLWALGEVADGSIDPARTVSTDAKGAFHFANLRPSEYRIAAWEKIEAGLGNASDFHTKFDGRATKLTLKEDARETVDPVLIPAEAIEAEAERLL